MKFCYIDETGLDGTDAATVMAGVIVDAHHLNKSLREWDVRLGDLLSHVGVSELKASQLYHGGNRYRKRMDGAERMAWIEESLEWLVARSMKIALSAVDRDGPDPREAYPELNNAWLACGFHVLLQLQKAYGSLKRNKGTTIIVMDQAKSLSGLSELLLAPPQWSDDYYGRGRREEPLKELVHTPFWVRSDHNTLIQLADLVAFVYRRYLEVKRAGESFAGEEDRLDGWAAILKPALLADSHRWPKRTSSDCAAAFCSWAPPELM